MEPVNNQNINISLTKTKLPSTVRSVKGFLVFLEEQLGKGQYGQVCRAKLAQDMK
jgi:hypothetical protein